MRAAKHIRQLGADNIIGTSHHTFTKENDKVERFTNSVESISAYALVGVMAGFVLHLAGVHILEHQTQTIILAIIGGILGFVTRKT